MKITKKLKNKYYFFIGTTAELIKLFPVMKEFNDQGIDFKVIASGQNNIEDSELLKIAGVKNIDIILHKGSIKQSATGLISWFWKTLNSGKKKLKTELLNVDKKNSYIIVHGDTVSTVMGALIAKKFRLKLAHIEAGLRSYNYLNPFPEEIDRVVVSHYTNISFCPNQWSVNNLKKQKAIKVNTLQNTLVDSLGIATSIKCEDVNLKRLPKEYFVFVMHRQENLFNTKLVNFMIKKIKGAAKNKKCVFILHEPTKVTLQKLNLLKSLEENDNFILFPRLPYISFMKVLKNSNFIITDGGSNQEESYYFGKPCLILRKATERIEGLNENVILSDGIESEIEKFIFNPDAYRRDPIIPKVNPSKIITDFFKNDTTN